ncbi:methyltransferase domain-containing protein [Streptomyces sp. CC210A]|uniref:methyltransferase domain-containing protein n=1 Tax=Streptomyces sp. CC210A TaxID=2898184 RepID=UPI001F1D1651|nr:methyltransferase domain-containing protein [Streptomyces sp. CC210A]
MARALAARLAGFGLSPVAAAQATARRAHFLGPAADRAVFHVGELENTGLPGGCAHGIVGADALGDAADRAAALRELGRVLASGGRLVVTRALRRGAQPAWHEQVAAAGLTQEHLDERHVRSRPAAEAVRQALQCEDCEIQRSAGLCKACGYRRRVEAAIVEAGLVAAAWAISAVTTKVRSTMERDIAAARAEYLRAIDPADQEAAASVLAYGALRTAQQALAEYQRNALAMLGRTEKAEAEARRAYKAEQRSAERAGRRVTTGGCGARRQERRPWPGDH